MKKQVNGTRISFFDENEKLIMEIDYSTDECIWSFYQKAPIIVEEDSVLFEPLKRLMYQQYKFDENPEIPLKNSKARNKLIWYSDCYYNPDNPISVKAVSRLNIEDNGDHLKIWCTRAIDEIYGTTKKSYCIAFSPLGNGQYSKNLETGSTFQDDFVTMIYQRLLKPSLSKKKITLDEYKEYLVKRYVHKCDNSKEKETERKNRLTTEYNDEYLLKIIEGTYIFISKLLELSNENYPGYITIPLEYEPKETLISLNLSGGWMSDTIIEDSNGNIYSIGIIKMIFGSDFIIEPCKTEVDEEWEIDGDFTILSEIPSYSTYIQCTKQIMDKVRNEVTDETAKKLEKRNDTRT